MGISPRIILAIIILIMAILIIWRHWTKDYLAQHNLVGATLLLIGIYLIWLELSIGNLSSNVSHVHNHGHNDDDGHNVMAGAPKDEEDD